MKTLISFYNEKIRHILYVLSILILLFFTGIIFIQSFSDTTGMAFLESVVSKNSLILLAAFGALAFVCSFLLAGKLLKKLSDKQQLIITIILAGICVTVQYKLLFNLQAVLRHDHLKVFDGALEIIRTGNLSLTANDSYFGNYPFNINVTIFNSFLLRIIQLLGIPEADYMLSLQCCYLFLIDLGIFFSWKIVRILHSMKAAALFSLLCFFNPIFYVCAAGCYTTTLMLPLLMGTLFLAVCMLKEQQPVKKILYGALFGIVLSFGFSLRATVFIAAIGLVIYLLIYQKNDLTCASSKKQVLIVTLSILLSAGCCLGAVSAVKNLYITEDYTDSQMPPLYYVMFAVNPETKGTYNTADHELISAYDTLEEKNSASLQILTERLQSMGLSGFYDLSKHKLKLTWCDAIEDYQDFIITSRNYSTLHSLIGEERGDFFALYCHIYHIGTLGLFLTALCFALFRKCDSTGYLIYITLLGGIIFHLFWEAYYIYSFGFCTLIFIPAAESLDRLSEKKHTAIPAAVLGIGALLGFYYVISANKTSILETEFSRFEKAVVQDMTLGENLPLMEGDTITQTFTTDRPFNYIGCKVFNSTGDANTSLYQIDLFAEDGKLLATVEHPAMYIPDKNYCYLKLPEDIQLPEGAHTYTIQIQALETTDEHYLTFAYYHSGNYDIYSDGSMTGLNSDAKTDLTFMAALSVTDTFNK